MTRVRLVLGLLAAMVLFGGLLAADDKTEPTKARGQLPTGWKKIGLSDDQTQQIYKLSSEYRSKIDELAAKIKELRRQERADMLKLLTDAQKTRLKELSDEKITGEVSKKTDPKKDDPKKDDPKKP